MGVLDYLKKIIKSNSEKKEDELKKLIPYENDINDYKNIRNHMLGSDFWEDAKECDYNEILNLLRNKNLEIVKNNVQQIIIFLTFRTQTLKMFGEVLGDKILKVGVFLEMSEEMYKHYLLRMIVVSRTLPFLKINISRSQRTLRSGKIEVLYFEENAGKELIFIDNKLIKIKDHSFHDRTKKMNQIKNSVYNTPTFLNNISFEKELKRLGFAIS